MGKLREQMELDLAIKRFSRKTQKTYLACVIKFAAYFKKSPDLMGREEVKKYLQYLIEEKNHSSSYVNQTYSALKFFYEVTLRTKWFMDSYDILRQYWREYRPKDWLFEGEKPETPITARSIQLIFKRSLEHAEIIKPATV